MGRGPTNPDAPLSDLRDAYEEVVKQAGKAEGKRQASIYKVIKAATRLVEFLGERGIKTTAQLEQASAIVAEFRDHWVAKAGAGDCSK